MKHPGVRAPITNLTIPPLAPAAVQEAYAIYDRCCDQLAELQGELSDARESINVGAKEAIAQDAAALVAGGKVKNRVVSQDRETAIQKLEQQIRTLELAAHIAGNELADAIGASKAEWVPVLQQAKAEAVEDYPAAIKQAQEAAKALGNLKRAAEWLALGSTTRFGAHGRTGPHACPRLTSRRSLVRARHRPSAGRSRCNPRC